MNKFKEGDKVVGNISQRTLYEDSSILLFPDMSEVLSNKTVMTVIKVKDSYVGKNTIVECSFPSVINPGKTSKRFFEEKWLKLANE